MRKAMFHPWCFTKLGMQFPPDSLPFLPLISVPSLPFPRLHLPSLPPPFRPSLYLPCRLVTRSYGWSCWTGRSVCADQCRSQYLPDSSFNFFSLPSFVQGYIWSSKAQSMFHQGLWSGHQKKKKKKKEWATSKQKSSKDARVSTLPLVAKQEDS